MESSSSLPLFYHDPAPLDAKKHRHLSLRKNFGFFFAQGANAVPINLIEMPQVCHFYPIAFSPDGNATPVALLGLRDGENLFLNADGAWREDVYIPAYIRRYPFIFSEVAGSDQLTLCVDMNPRILVEDGSQPFFNPDGSPSPLSLNALDFCKSYHAAAEQTQAFSKLIAQSGLLVSREAQIQTENGKGINFSGFRIIDEERLAHLEDGAYLYLREKGFLPFIYAHLFSGAQWQRLTRLLRARMKEGSGVPVHSSKDDGKGGSSTSPPGARRATPIASAFEQILQR